MGEIIADDASDDNMSNHNKCLSEKILAFSDRHL